MKTPQEIFQMLQAQFGDAVISQNDKPLFENTIEIQPQAIRNVCFYLRETAELAVDNLMLLSAVDDANGEKKTEADGSFQFIGGTVGVFYHLDSTSLKHKVVLHVSLPRENPEIETISDIYAHGDWEEREAYDMIGIKFLNHPDLRRILMPYDWEGGYPLRKDYKNPEFYQGMRIPY
jgi:NADH-quinone oxidoreductase subunit C